MRTEGWSTMPREIKAMIMSHMLWTSPETESFKSWGTMPTLSVILSNDRDTPEARANDEPVLKVTSNFNYRPMHVCKQMREVMTELVTELGLLLQVRPAWNYENSEKAGIALGCDLVSLKSVLGYVKYLQIRIPALAMGSSTSTSYYSVMNKDIYPRLIAVHIDGSDFNERAEHTRSRSALAYESVLKRWKEHDLDSKQLIRDQHCSQYSCRSIEKSPVFFLTSTIDIPSAIDDGSPVAGQDEHSNHSPDEEALPSDPRGGILLRAIPEEVHRTCYRLATSWYGGTPDIENLANTDEHWKIFHEAPKFDQDEPSDIYEIHVTCYEETTEFEANSRDSVHDKLEIFAEEAGGYERIVSDFDWSGVSPDRLSATTTFGEHFYRQHDIDIEMIKIGEDSDEPGSDGDDGNDGDDWDDGDGDDDDDDDEEDGEDG